MKVGGFQFVQIERLVRLHDGRSALHVPFYVKDVLLVGVGKVFIPGMLDKERAEAFFDRLFSNIEHIDIAEMNGKHILLSLGACFYDGMDCITFDQLYRRADTAMYDSKKKQGYSATIFDAKQ